MATYDNLPVYKESYDLLVELFRFTKDFGKDYKYTIGESIKNKVIEMITNIYHANSTITLRGQRIGIARENVEVIRLYIRLLYDLRQIDLDKFIGT